MNTRRQALAATTLRGRDSELGSLARLLDLAQSGVGGWLLLEGAAGTGKSALLRAFSAQATLRGMAVGLTEADEIDASAALNTLTRALAPMLDGDRLDRLRATVGSGYWAVQEIRTVMQKTAANGPVVMVVDDVAWADDASLQALRSLVLDLSGHAVSWLFASRPDRRPAYRRLREGAHNGHLLRLNRLADVHRAQIMWDVLGAEPDDAVLAVVGDTAGHLTDLVDRLVEGVESQAFVVEGDRACLSADAGRRLFDDEIAQRVSRLSPAARRAVDVAAVLGTSFRLADLANLLDTSTPRLITELRELMAEHLIIDDGGALAFKHELVRTAVLDKLPATVRRALNQEAALHLLSVGSAPVDVAPYVLAATGPDQPAPAPLAEAAEQVTSAAAAEALTAYQRALEFAGTGSRQWLSLVAPTARALAYGGRVADADELLNRAMSPDLDIADEAELRIVRADVAWLRGRGFEETLAVERVLAHPALPPGLNGKLRAALGSLTALTGRSADALAAADEAIIAARSLRDHHTLGTALLAGSVALRFLGRMDESLAYATESASVARRVPGAKAREPRIWLARTLSALDRLDDAQGYCEDVLREVHDEGNVSMLPAAYATRARILLIRGQTVDAAADAEAGIAAAEATGSTQMSAELWSILAFVRAVTGPLDLALQTLGTGEAVMATGVRDMGHLPLTRGALQSADPAVALSECAGLIDGLGTSFGPLVFDPAVAPFLARIAMAAGDRRRVQALAGAAARLAALNPCVLGWSAAQLHVTGLMSDDASALRDAARGFTRVGRHFAAATALVDASVLALRQGEARAHAWMDEATTAFESMGAPAIVTYLRAQDARRGSRRGTRAGRSMSGWDSLTSAELRVVALAATGASNKEIAQHLWLSPHTVDTHVRHALEKLGLRSRVEMARQAGERGIAGSERGAPDAVLAPVSTGTNVA